MKKLLCIFLLLFLTIPKIDAQTIIKGDMNNDGDITISDAVNVVEVILGNTPKQTISSGENPYSVDNTMVVGTWYAPDGTSFAFNENGTTTFPGGVTYEFMPLLGRLLVYDAQERPVKVLPLLKVKTEYLLAIDYATGAFTYYTNQNSLPTGIILNQTSLEMDSGNTTQLTATISPETAFSWVSWTSSDKTVATVDDNGVVTAYAEGVCTITATASGGVSANCTVIVTQHPKHRVLLEVYTGTWDQYSPRGIIALEKLETLYPEDYVLVNYHLGDPMQITSVFPMNNNGLPEAWPERRANVDPYYGINQNDFGIIDVLKWCSALYGFADINITAKLTDDEETVEVTTNVTFSQSSDDVNYALEYILLIDGLTGYSQANGYAGGSQGGDFLLFNQAGNWVDGLVYNNVAVMLSQIGGIEGSIPTIVQANVPISHSYSFNLAEAVNISGESLIHDKEKLKVAVLLIDKNENIVTNSNKTIVTK